MDMHELEQAWRGVDRRLAEQNLILEDLRRVSRTAVARDRLRLLSLGQLVQLAFGAAVTLWAGSYWFEHRAQLSLLVSGVALHLYGLALVVVSSLQLVLVASLDYRAPTLEVQRRLLALRRVRITGERALLVLGFVAWVPFFVIAVGGLGIDLWSASPASVLLNLAVGLGLAAFVGWLTVRFRARFEADATGRSLRRAEAELAELAASDSPRG